MLDGAGKLVRRYSSADAPVDIRDQGNVPSYWIRPSPVVQKTTGLHRFVWDLHYTPPPGERAYPIAATPHNTASEPKGPWVVPGTYSVKLTVNGKSFTQPLTVRMDPRVKSGILALQQQFTVSKRLYDAMVTLGELEPKVTAARDRAQAAGQSDVATKLTAVIGGGGRGRGRGSATTASTLPALAGQLAALYALSQDGSGPPPTQTAQAIDAALKQYTSMVAQIEPLLR